MSSLGHVDADVNIKVSVDSNDRIVKWLYNMAKGNFLTMTYSPVQMELKLLNTLRCQMFQNVDRICLDIDILKNYHYITFSKEKVFASDEPFEKFFESHYWKYILQHPKVFLDEYETFQWPGYCSDSALSLKVKFTFSLPPHKSPAYSFAYDYDDTECSVTIWFKAVQDRKSVV